MVRWRRVIFSGLAIVVALLVFYPHACSSVEKQSLIVDADRITIVNLSDRTWSGVDVWLNDHYRGQARELAPGQRLDMPTRLFVAGWGQHYDPARQSPYGVEITAKRADGTPVRLSWGEGRRR